MLRSNAVLFTILFALAVTVGSVSYTFYQLYQINRTKHIDNIFTKYSLINQIFHTYLLKQISQPMFEANLALYDLSIMEGEKEYRLITKRGELLRQEGKVEEEALEHDLFEMDAPFQHISISEIRSSMYSYKGKIYFLIESTHNSVLLEDRSIEPYNPINLLSAYVTIIGILIVSFGLIIFRLSPLRHLRKQIARFGEGDLGVSFKMAGNDEISLIANELENTQSKIRSLIESRTLFLRNIMHELKTPIAKGRIASSMLADEKQKGRFERIFERLEGLISEFALIEEITSGSQHLEKSEYRLIDIIDDAIDRAMIDHEAIDIAVDPHIKLNVDFRLFVTAVKNMIDNAIKYSPDNHVEIKTVGEEIGFSNRGKPLEKPLSYYVEPFTKDQPTKDSFGLGLYIVDAILKEHGFILAYEYKDGINNFIFVPEKRNSLKARNHTS